jgi:hypothetical protein
MTDTKISGLPAATSIANGDYIPIVQSGTTKKLDFAYMNPCAPIHPPTTGLFTQSAAASPAATSVTAGSLAYTMLRTDTGTASAERAAFRGKAVPAGTSWTVTAIIRPPIIGRDVYLRSGLALYESATGKLIYIGHNTQANAPAFVVYYFSNLSTFSTQLAGFNEYQLSEYWVRVSYDGTNYSWSFSQDFGNSWITMVTEAKATRFTTAADQVGLVLESFGAITASRFALSCTYWNDPDFVSTFGP